ncbi:MAG: tRNA (adenosine(37)-N6)-threonylcarbamoyltransferase complex ATPase subunit type 1 TsaE [Clostridia bacterium]|nr:tRNA (adenosine(37)-N6)-threonylcarbamoyltransferase complex ATPase subunit type 1 TsaE [Clostridia bacterium]
MEIILKTEKDTIEFAKKFSKQLKAGDVLLLDGDLGAGKTVFTKGLVLGLSGGKEIAISPTFTIVNEYNTTPKLYHFDFYRIKSEDELVAIGIEEYLFSDAICVVEWPERAPNILSMVKTKTVKILKVDGGRKIILNGEE